MADVQDFGDLVAIAQGRSLTVAAKARGVAVSTLSRRVHALEAKLGLPLVDRRADGVRLTQAGARIAEAAGPMAEQLMRVLRLVDSLRAACGVVPVRVSATEFVVSDVLAPALPRLWRAGAVVPVHLHSQSDVVSLAARDADLAIRMVRPEGASLYVRKLAELRLGFYASADYLNARAPQRIDLRGERLLAYDDSYGRLPELDWMVRQGLAEAVVLRTGSTRGLLTAALAGAGIALLPVAVAVRSGGLVEIPTDASLPSRQPWLAVHRDLRKQPDVTTVKRWITDVFKELSAAQ